jgi:hypothetical protein
LQQLKQQTRALGSVEYCIIIGCEEKQLRLDLTANDAKEVTLATFCSLGKYLKLDKIKIIRNSLLYSE